MAQPEKTLLDLSAAVVSAYARRNYLRPLDLILLIESTHAAFQDLGKRRSKPVDLKQGNLVPAVPIKKSITPYAIICLEDGKPFKSLRRHLNEVYGLSPEAYRQRWGLPSDYPMVAPKYAERRSVIAKQTGLGMARWRAG